MDTEDKKRLKKLIPKEIFTTFNKTGIIDDKGNLKDPYKDLQIPVK